MNESKNSSDSAFDKTLEKLTDTISSNPTQLALALLVLAQAVRPKDRKGKVEFDRLVRKRGMRIQRNLRQQGRDHTLLSALLLEMTR